MRKALRQLVAVVAVCWSVSSGAAPISKKERTSNFLLPQSSGSSCASATHLPELDAIGSRQPSAQGVGSPPRNAPLLASVIVIPLGEEASVPLTSAAEGVSFDIDADGTPERVAWTRADSDTAFLAMDTDGNGSIDRGSEMFGNHAVRGASNGLAALAQIDATGGDGAIDSGDPVYYRLLLWSDRNHNGRSEPEELRPAREVLAKVGLGYFGADRSDEHGNVFRFEGWFMAIDDLTGGPNPSRPLYEVALAISR